LASTDTFIARTASRFLHRSSWGTPTVDVLASASNPRAPDFFSKGFDVGTSAVDAYRQPWPVYKDGLRQLYWVFPGPVSDQLPAVRKLMEEQCDAIFLAPTRSKQPWLGSLHQLPIIDSVFFPALPADAKFSPASSSPAFKICSFSIGLVCDWDLAAFFPMRMFGGIYSTF
jgi:hypothetical protein